MTALWVIITAAAAYLLGSVNSALVVGKVVYHKDIRQYGSGNAGTTNALRVLGGRASLVVLAGDILKGVLAALIGRLLMGEVGAYLGALFVMLGHMYPVFFGFRGGKGVATVAGALIMVDWRLFLSVILVFLLLFLIWHTVSISSLGAAVAAPFAAYLLNGGNWTFTGLTLLLALSVIVKHHANIGRIFAGTEPKTELHKKKT